MLNESFISILGVFTDDIHLSGFGRFVSQKFLCSFQCTMVITYQICRTTNIKSGRLRLRSSHRPISPIQKRVCSIHHTLKNSSFNRVTCATHSFHPEFHNISEAYLEHHLNIFPQCLQCLR